MDTVLQTLENISAFIVIASLKGSVLTALVLAVQRVPGPALPANWRYMLWFSVVFALVTPVGYDTALLPQVHDIEADTAAAVRERGTDVPPSPLEPRMDTSQLSLPAVTALPQIQEATAMYKDVPYVPTALLSLLWLAGVLVVFGAIARSAYAFARLMRRAHPAPASLQALLNDCLAATRCARSIALLQSSEVDVPMIAGQLRPILLLPAGLERQLTNAQLRHVFIHELMHLQRGDIVGNWIVAFVQALHWFNPLVWYAFFRMRQDRELACDAATLRHLAPAETAAYGRTLLQLNDALAAPVPVVALGMLHDSSHLRRRILMLAHFSQRSALQRLAAALVMLPLAALAFSQPVAASREAGTVAMPAPDQAESVAQVAAPRSVNPETLQVAASAASDSNDAVASPSPLPRAEVATEEESVARSPASAAPAAPESVRGAEESVQREAETPEATARETEALPPDATAALDQPATMERAPSATLLAAVSSVPAKPAPQPVTADTYVDLSELERLAERLASMKADKLAFIERWNALGMKCDARKEGFLGVLSASCQRIRTAQRRGDIFRFAYECYQLNAIHEQLVAEYRATARRPGLQRAEELLGDNERELNAICSEDTYASQYPAFAAMFADAEALKYYPPRQPVSDRARVAAIEARVWRYHSQGTSASVIDPLNFPQPTASFVPLEYPGYAPSLPAPTPIAPAPAPAQ
ncbi:MAG: M56 family metallopeptidase [Gammaproteobacteria bacterium]